LHGGNGPRRAYLARNKLHNGTLGDQTEGGVIRGGGESGSIDCVKPAAVSLGEAHATPSGTEIGAVRGRMKSTAAASASLPSWQQDREHFIASALFRAAPPWCSHSIGVSAAAG